MHSGRLTWGVAALCLPSVLVSGSMSLGCSATDGEPPLAAAGFATGGARPGVESGGSGGVGGSAQSALPFAKSGARLEALAYIADGAEQFRTLRDRELGFDCEFALDARGERALCVPTRRDAIVYLDANCAEPAVWGGYTGGYTVQAGDWLSAHSAASQCPGSIPPHREVFRVREQVVAEATPGSPQRAVYSREGSTCVIARHPGRLQPSVHRLIAQDDAQFVGAVRRRIALADGLHVERWVAEDGAELTFGLSSGAGTACAIQSNGECVPEPLALRGQGKWGAFLDATCSVASFHSVSPTDCGEPSFGVSSENAEAFRVYRLQPANELWALSPGVAPDEVDTCGPAEGTMGRYDFMPAEDVTGSFPKAQRVLRGSGPLQLEWFAAQGRTPNDWVLLKPVQATGVFTSGAGSTCVVREVADGTLRCVFGSFVGESSWFEDRACSARLYVAPASSAAAVTRDDLLLEQTNERGLLSAIFTLELHDGETYAWINGSCDAQSAEQPLFTPRGHRALDSFPVVMDGAL